MRYVFRFFIFFFLAFVSLNAAKRPEVLPLEKAFQISATQNSQGVFINIILGDKIYLYDDKLKLEITKPKHLDITSWVSRPKAELFHDYKTQRKPFELFVPQSLLDNEVGEGNFRLKFSYQGCSELGICYEPSIKEYSFKMGGNAPLKDANTALSEQDEIAKTLLEGNVLWVLLSFFGFGLLLSLTPCVFPMIPILSSIIVSQPSAKMNAKKGFFLSLVYVLSMSVAYTMAGVLAALFGSNLQASMQHPYVIVAFSLIFVALAFSMFGFYEIKMPNAISNRLSKKSGEAQGQGILGIGIMGFLSALIVGPCVAAPLAGALIYIGQSGDALLGGSALFMMSLGMGAPLLLIGTTAGRYMPRPGVWMQNVTAFFGVLMLGVAVWMLSRIVPSIVNMALWMVLLISSSIYFGAIEPAQKGWQRVFKTIPFMGLIYGITLFVGLVSGATDPLKPLERFTSSSVASSHTTMFKLVKNTNELDSALKNSTMPVMLDFYADWCVNCVEFEKFTFSDERVKAKLEKMTLLKVDVTKNSANDKALQKRFDIFNPPAILFFKDAEEIKSMRLVGFKNADEFLKHLEDLGL